MPFSMPPERDLPNADQMLDQIVSGDSPSPELPPPLWQRREFLVAGSLTAGIGVVAAAAGLYLFPPRGVVPISPVDMPIATDIGSSVGSTAPQGPGSAASAPDPSVPAPGSDNRSEASSEQRSDPDPSGSEGPDGHRSADRSERNRTHSDGADSARPQRDRDEADPDEPESRAKRDRADPDQRRSDQDRSGDADTRYAPDDPPAPDDSDTQRPDDSRGGSADGIDPEPRDDGPDPRSYPDPKHDPPQEWMNVPGDGPN